MKKLFRFVLAMVMLLSLVACGAPAESEPNEFDDPAPSCEVEGELSEELEIEASTEPDPVEEVDELDVDAADREGITAKLVEIGLTEDEAKAGCDILYQCGFTSISEFEKISGDSLDGLVQYAYKPDKDRTYRFVMDHRVIFYVALNGEDLYDADLGGLLKTVDDVHIPETSMTEDVKRQLVKMAEEELDAYFGESRYYDAWGVGRADDKYVVQCEASDGSLATSGWIRMRVWYHDDGDDTFRMDGIQPYGYVK